MSDQKLKHLALTKLRGTAYKELFGSKPEMVFPFHSFSEEDDAYLIDIFTYRIDLEECPAPATVAVTNGLSDYVMTDSGTGERSRCELIQYFHECDYEHALRLYELAWIPLYDKFSIGEYKTIEMPEAVVEGNPLKNAIFLPPVLKPHRNFRIDIEEMPVRLLWHVPISDAELRYKKEEGVNSLIQRMETIELPWIFDETERPAIVS